MQVDLASSYEHGQRVVTHEGRMDRQQDRDAVEALVAMWHETRKWAESLICSSLKLDRVEEVFCLERPLVRTLAGGWVMRVHGVGVDVSKPCNVGGIDFDFGVLPCSGRLRDFMIKQYNAGNLTKKIYRPLMQDPKRFEHAWEGVGMEEHVPCAERQLLYLNGWPTETWREQSYDQYSARYTGFGSLFFTKVNETHPHVFEAMRFYRNVRWQTRDAFAVCSTPHPFAVQLDPDCEIMCFWDGKGRAEFGQWSPTYEQDALEYIVAHFL